MGTITDSTTTIDTDWTEYSKPIPAFTAGILATQSACVEEVEGKLQRGTLGATSVPTDTQVKNWLMRAKLKLMQVRDFSFARKFAYVALQATQSQIVLPPDYQGGEVTLTDMSNNLTLRQWPLAWYRKRYPDPSDLENGKPLIFAINNQEMWIAPPTDAAITVRLEYSRSGAETTAGDFSWLPEYERFLCCDFAVAEAFESIHMWEEADRYRSRWNEELKFSVRADGRRKWKQEQMQVINIFQEHIARNSQRNA